MPSFVYPTSAELRLIDQELMPRLQEGRVVFDFFPTEETDNHLIRWDIRDNYTGLQNIRGLNGEPPRVKRVGAKQFQMAPGIFGEFEVIDEQELTTRRQYGTFGEPVRIDDLVSEAEEHLLERELDRMELIIWTLLATGTFSVSSINNQVIYTDSYTTQTYSAGVTWATSATATPLANFRAVQLLSRGKGVNFGAQAKAYMNRGTFNAMVSNTNQADIAGRRTSGLNTLLALNLKEINTVFMAEDLPEVVVYDQGYLDDTATFQLFVPNNKVVVVGARPGNEKVGAYRITRNANNPDMGPGAYSVVHDSMDAGKPPRKIEVHRGHNGGCAIYWPSAIVQMSV